jgi:predicted aconitase with swiveling domain
MSSGEKIILKGHPGVGPPVEGEAIVSEEGFSARYDYDRYRGVISRKTHALYGQSIVGKVAVFRTTKGGVATSWMMLDMVERGTCPAGFIFGRTNPVMVQGAVLANVALMHELDPDPVEVIQTGDYVKMIPGEGIVEVMPRKA